MTLRRHQDYEVILEVTLDSVLEKKLVTFCLHGTNIWCSPDELHKWAEIKMHLERSSSDSLDEMDLALWQGNETNAEMVVLKHGQI